MSFVNYQIFRNVKAFNQRRKSSGINCRKKKWKKMGKKGKKKKEIPHEVLI